MGDPLRFHRSHHHLHGAFGSNFYGRFAEGVARTLGTPAFLFGQTFILIIWVILNGNLLGLGVQWDFYPFILLNLMLSFQAAYAAPLILVSQTRQAERDRVSEQAAALHRQEEFDRLALLLEENTEITKLIHALSIKVNDLTEELRDHILQS